MWSDFFRNFFDNFLTIVLNIIFLFNIMTSDNLGYRFEHYVMQLYKDLDKRRLRHDVTLDVSRKKHRVQIDIIYRRFLMDHYVECKYRKDEKKVDLSEVAKFYAVLELLEVSPRRGEMITNSYYTKRAREYANNKSIKLYDLDDMIKMEKERTSILERFLKGDLDIEQKIKDTKIEENKSKLFEFLYD